MKTFVFISVVLCTLIFGSLSWKSTAASVGQKRTGVAEFTKPVSVQGVLLQGTYLFVHDDAAMNRGDACTFIYQGVAEQRDKLVTSFHCIHVERKQVKNFVWRTRENASGITELVDFQFTGETAAHAVPASSNVAVVPIVN
jgi:hypothetical protein